MIFDVHAHCFPDHLAEKAIGKLSEHSAPYKPFTKGTIDDLVKSMDHAGVEASLIASIATNSEQFPNIMKWSINIHSKRIIPLGSVYPFSENFKKEIDELKKNNIPGIKLHPMYQNFSIDDKALYPVYDYIRSSNLFILMHAGNDIAFPGDTRALSFRIRKVLKDFPGIKMIAAHLGGWQEWEEVSANIAGKDIYFDTSFINEIDEKVKYEILSRHNSDLIVFGSDSPWQEQKAQAQCVHDLKISDDKKEKIFSKNALALLNSVDYKPVR